MIDEIYNSVYLKFTVVLILSVLITFAHEINVFKDGAVCYIVMIILLLLIYTKEDLGFVLLLASLMIINYNLVVFKKHQKIETDLTLS